MQTLVLGIGNTLLSDEGIGVHALHYLQTHYPELPGTTCIDGGTLSFTLAGEIEQADRLIVIDAAQLHAAPGTVRSFVNEDMDSFLGQGNQRSVHEVGLLDLLQISRLTGRLPGQRTLIGIQPEKIDWGESPSPAVSAAIPRICELVVQHIEKGTA